MNEEDIGNIEEYINSIISFGNTKIIFDNIAIGINRKDMFLNPNGIHGKGHTIRVLKLLSLISSLEQLTDNEKRILAYAGLYHDIGRANDCYDLTHGRMSYEKLVSSGLTSTIKLNKQDFKILKYIIENINRWNLMCNV